MLMHLRSGQDEETEPRFVIPGKAAGRDPESSSPSLDSRFRGNDENDMPVIRDEQRETQNPSRYSYC
jgi:hypothetical protein